MAADRPEAIAGNLLGAVLCGGESKRFGSDKALSPAGDQLLGARVVQALRSGGVDPVVAVGGTAGPALGLITVPDRWPGAGPLAALATILWWARRGDVLVVPCDLALLPKETVEQLVAERGRLREHGDQRAIVASVNGKPKHSLAVWPATFHSQLRAQVEAGERRFSSALEVVPWQPMEVPASHVADADTPDELARLLDGRS